MKEGEMRYQRGLSLVMVAIVMAVLAFMAVLGLMSMRSEKNLFGDALSSLMKSAPVQQAQQAATTPAAPIRKCTIGGKAVYSNVDCPAGAADSQAVQLHDTRGVEAPKAPPAPPAADPGAELRDKAIERAVSR
jgi:glutamine amidotransferase PdxT